MVMEVMLSPQAKIENSPRFTQLIGGLGTGCRRLALDFLPSLKSAVWISHKWNLYAPLLWKMASERGLHLLGVECPQKKFFRPLCKTLLESQIFDAWILDSLQLTQAEGMFLHKFLRPLPRPSKILVLDGLPQSFC